MPDRANTANRQKDALFTQFVTGFVLTMGRKFNRIGDHRLLNGVFNSVLQIWRTPAFFQRYIYTAIFSQLAITTEV
jgi:hypothetical protein